MNPVVMSPLVMSILGLAGNRGATSYMQPGPTGQPQPPQGDAGPPRPPVAQPVQQPSIGQQPKLMPGGGGATGLTSTLPLSVTSSEAPQHGGMTKDMAAAVGGLAALPMAVGSFFANRPPTLMSGADEFVKQAQNQQQTAIQQATAANPNMNQALAQRNAAQAAMQQSQSIADQAARMRVEEENQRRIAAQQAKQQRVQGVLNVLGQAINTGATAASFMSDERIKTNIQPAGPQVGQMLSALSPQQFDVPALGQQQRTGVMAQDLLQSPMGARMVQPTPDGTLAVDTNAAAEGALASSAYLNERLNRLEQDLVRRAGGSIQGMVQQDVASRQATPTQASPAPSMESGGGLSAPTPSTPPAMAPAAQSAVPQTSPTPGQSIPDQVSAALARQFGTTPGNTATWLTPGQSPPSAVQPAYNPAQPPLPAGPQPEITSTGYTRAGELVQEPTYSTASGMYFGDKPPAEFTQQDRIDRMARTDASVAPTETARRQGILGANPDEPWVQKVLAWEPSTTGRLQFTGPPEANQTTLQTLRTAMAASPSFRDLVMKFDASQGSPITISSVRDHRGTQFGAFGAAANPQTRQRRQTIDIGDLGQLPSILDQDWRTSDVPGFNREAFLVHEVTEAMVAEGLRSNDPQDHARAWKLYAEAHPTAAAAERDFLAYLGQRSQRGAEVIHPGAQGAQAGSARSRTSGSGFWNPADPNQFSARFSYTDGYVDVFFDRQTGDIVSIRRVPNAPQSP